LEKRRYRRDKRGEGRGRPGGEERDGVRKEQKIVEGRPYRRKIDEPGHGKECAGRQKVIK